jgi:hypothetical protein
MNQGSKANKNGRALEDVVRGVFIKRGFVEVSYNKFCKKPADYFGEELLIRNYPAVSIYGSKIKTEFYLSSVKYNCKIRIECKWQQVAGTVDEKYPYLYLNCIDSMPEKDIIILLDGKGYRETARAWLKNAIEDKKYQSINSGKNIQLFTITEFMRWANNKFDRW